MMLGEKLLDKFSEYDILEVDRTFGEMSEICAVLSGSRRGRTTSDEYWKRLVKLSEELDYIFFEDS